MKLFHLQHKRQSPSSRISWERTSLPLIDAASDGRHHLEGVTYVLPKDLPEAHRLDFQHHLLHAILQGNSLAPIGIDIKTILDVATGTGRWAHEMARAFPAARVVGLDMEAPTQPTSIPPSNYEFVQRNLFAGLPFFDQSFDLVHMRFLVLVLPAKQWPFVVSELVRVTRPGGFVELVEGGGNFSPTGPATRQLQQWWDVASQTHGISVSLMAHLPLMLQQAGLHAIEHKTFRTPVGRWGGHVGAMLKQDLLASLPALKPFICTQASVPPDAFDNVCTALPAEWENNQTVYEYYVAYGQR